MGNDGKARPAHREKAVVHRSPTERQARNAATTLICGDCRTEMKKLASGSVDAIICDPIYPEVDREYGRMSEKDWHAMMREVVAQRSSPRPAGF